MKSPIVLIGPMGVGKTTIGKKLAKALDLNFVDTDAIITKRDGSIPKIFETQGEDFFRVRESEALKLALTEGGVVATGGGIILRQENREELKNAFVIYLETDGRHIAARLVAGKRPLIKNGAEDWKRIYEQRKPLYESSCDLKISTNGKTLSKVVAEIVEIRNG
ncbi:MAG: shikimate kinase [Actinomycetota bacterium]